MIDEQKNILRKGYYLSLKKCVPLAKSTAKCDSYATIDNNSPWNYYNMITTDKQQRQQTFQFKFNKNNAYLTHIQNLIDLNDWAQGDTYKPNPFADYIYNFGGAENDEAGLAKGIRKQMEFLTNNSKNLIYPSLAHIIRVTQTDKDNNITSLGWLLANTNTSSKITKQGDFFYYPEKAKKATYRAFIPDFTNFTDYQKKQITLANLKLLLAEFEINNGNKEFIAYLQDNKSKIIYRVKHKD